MTATSTADVRVGLIGYGYWGPKLARNFSQLPGARLAVVADLHAERLAEVDHLYPEATVTRDHRDVLDGQVDAVVIATPVAAHYPLVKAALQAGKHVLVEKPITNRSDHAEELIELAGRAGLTLMVGHTFQYNPAVEAVRDVIRSGELGRIYYLNATRANLGLLQPDINVLWDLAPHDLSILQFVLDADPERVSARGACYVNSGRGLHEVGYLNLVFPDGVMANVRVSWLDPVKQRRLTVIGSRKMLVYDDIADDKVVIYDKGVEVHPYTVTEEEFRASYHHGDETVYPLEWVEPLRSECTHFVDCIRSGGCPRSDGRSGLRIVKVLETAQRSLRNGGVELQVEY